MQNSPTSPIRNLVQDYRKLSLLFFAMVLMSAGSALAQTKPSLQTLFNESTAQAKAVSKATSSVIVVDLSEWESDYDETLTIKNGKSYKFTNGQLNWVGGDAPLFELSNGSSAEFAEGVTISSKVSAYSPLVFLRGSAFVKVSGAELNASKRPIPQGAMYGVWRKVDALQIDENTTNNTIEVTDGIIEGSITSISSNFGNTIKLTGGYIWAAKSNGRIVFSGSVQLFDMTYDHEYPQYDGIDLGSHGVACLTSSYITSQSSGLPIPGTHYSFCSLFSIDMETCKDRVLVEGGNNYQITKNDLAKMTVKDLDMDKYELVLENNKVVIREKTGNLIDSEEKLRKAIETAGVNTKTPVEICIAKDIYLTKTINIEDKNIKLSGGYKLIRDAGFTGKLFDLCRVSLTLENIIIDGNKSCFTNTDYVDCAFMLWNNTTLKFGKDFYIENNFTNYGHNGLITQGSGYSNVIFDGGTLRNNLVKQSPLLSLYGCRVQINDCNITNNECSSIFDVGQLVMLDGLINNNFCSFYGITLSYSSDNRIAGGFIGPDQGGIRGGNFVALDSPESVKDTLYIEGQNCYLLGAPLKSKLYFKGTKATASDYVLYDGKVLIHGGSWSGEYTITSSDANNIIFMSDDWKTEYKPDQNCMVIKKKKKGRLPDLFDDAEDDDDKGTDDNPKDIMGDADEVGLDEQEDMPKDLHILFGEEDDKPDGSGNTKSFSLGIYDGDYAISIPPTSSIEFKNIDIDLGESGISSFIEVYGKLIINVNVYIRNVCTCTKRVIYVRKGGTLVWRGGRNSLPGVVVYNEGGTIIYEGGDTYGTTYGIHNLSGGTVHVKGGTLGGGEHAIYNEKGGSVYVYDGCTIDGSVWSEGTFTTGGNINYSGIHLSHDSFIYVTSRIRYDWNIYLTTAFDCKVPHILVRGGNGYQLTEEDMNRIHIDLPTGYFLILDVKLNIIYIGDASCTGISDATVTDKAASTIYSIDGTLGNDKSGLKIVRSADGKVRKIATK